MLVSFPQFGHHVMPLAMDCIAMLQSLHSHSIEFVVNFVVLGLFMMDYLSVFVFEPFVVWWEFGPFVGLSALKHHRGIRGRDWGNPRTVW